MTPDKWDQVRALLLKPGRNTNVRTPTKYLLTGLIHCGTCRTGWRLGHATSHKSLRVRHRRQPIGERVAEGVLEVLTAESIRDALLDEAGATGGRSLRNTLADLAAAQTALQGLDHDFYVRGLLQRADIGR